VPPVGLAVVEDADRHAPVPLTVVALVDARRAVWRACAFLALTGHGVIGVLSGGVLLGEQAGGVGGQGLGWYAAQAADADRGDVAVFEQGVHGGAADAEVIGGGFDGEQGPPGHGRLVGELRWGFHPTISNFDYCG
jgi:hypothetical protein